MKGWLILLLLVLGSNASAQTSWFAEIALGESDIQSEAGNQFVVPYIAMLGGSSCIPVSNCYNNIALSSAELGGDLAMKLAVGRDLGRYFAVDLGYQHFKDFEGRDEQWPADLQTSQSLDGFTLSGTARLPVSDSLSLFAKAGIMRYDSEKTEEFSLEASNSTFRPFDPASIGLDANDVYADDQLIEIRHDDSGTAAIYSLGASYAINSSLELKLEYQHIPDVADIEIDLYTLGVAIRF